MNSFVKTASLALPLVALALGDVGCLSGATDEFTAEPTDEAAGAYGFVPPILIGANPCPPGYHVSYQGSYGGYPAWSGSYGGQSGWPGFYGGQPTWPAHGPSQAPSGFGQYFSPGVWPGTCVR